MSNSEFQVVFIDFPTKGSEAVTKNEDDSYTIFINSKLSRERQLKAYKHALEHIKNNDFNRSDANQIELRRHDLEVSAELFI